MVKYCNRECQIAHRPQHKKECRKRAAKLYDVELFKQPPPAEDSVRYVFYECQHYILEGFTWHVVERLFAVDVFMHRCMMTKAMKLIIKSVRSVELRTQLQMRRE